MGWPTVLQLANVAVFALVIVFNTLSSLPSRPFGASNADISNRYATAFTPAGYAFSIWGVIYSFNASFLVYQTYPSRAEWVRESIGWEWATNALWNSAWIVTFATELGRVWVSTVIITFGILGTLLRLYCRLDIGRSGFGVARASAERSWVLTAIAGPRPARPADITFGEWLTTHTWVSVYTGWVSVASIANISIALTANGVNLGWTAGNWSVLMQAVGALLALVMLIRRQDVAFAAPIAWALVAIGSQQRSDAYPGGPIASQAGFALGYTVAAAAGVTALYRGWRFYKGVTRFAGAVVDEQAGDWVTITAPKQPTAGAAPRV